MKTGNLKKLLMAAVGFTAAMGLILGQSKIVKKPIVYTPPDDGPGMYAQYCASCHGTDGKGNGPAASALSTPATDLTKIAKENNGEFSAFAVMNTLTKGEGAGAHGSTDMPVWGEVFRASWQSDSDARIRIYNLTRYVESLQEPAERVVKTATAKSEPTPKYVRDVRPSSGSEMYRWYCSSCHGASGTGDGPSAASLKSRPTDLTMIAKNNNGVFPALQMNNVLGAAPGTTAHGTKEMPIWGDAFRAAREDTNIVQMRIHNIVLYLKSIQK